MASWHPLLLLLIVVHALVRYSTLAAFAPNHFLGTCLDSNWVKSVEAQYSISAAHRGGEHHALANPYLHAALKSPRFEVYDSRTDQAIDQLYQSDCQESNDVFYGVGATLDSSGKVIDPGRVNNTLVIELRDWTSIQLTTLVFSILANELLGYEISMYNVHNRFQTAQRMSSVGDGVCAPTHLNVETWMARYTEYFDVYENETASIGSVGYSSLSGVYISKDFIADGLNSTKHAPTFSADFWRDYTESDDLINSLAVSVLKNNSAFYPPTVSGCANGSFGCLNSCSKTESCTVREAQGGECMVVAMMYDRNDPGYLQAVFANLKIPSYFCFMGESGVESFVMAMHQNNTPVAFYHFEPDPFHVMHNDYFERIFLPRAVPEKVAVNTKTFGEHGYGGKTDNPVVVDFQSATLEKFLASFVTEYSPLIGLMTQLSISPLDMNDLLENYVTVVDTAEDPVFTAACDWIKSNYETWNGWLEALPICNMRQHMRYTLIGCDPDGDGNITAFPRQVDFEWAFPNPENASLAYNCDGGISSVPTTFSTSKSCTWLQDNYEVWIDWILAKPACDASFFFYNATDCDQPGTQRRARFYWYLPDPHNTSRSLECEDGLALPADVLFECEYVPYHTTNFKAATIFAGILACVFVLAMIVVFCFRSAPIIKRSQFQFLESMLLGSILMCGATVLYAGKPSKSLCQLRPSIVSYAFTLIFGSLLVKSMRVYRVFLSSAMKRVKVSSFTMFKFLLVFLLIDFGILATWMNVDPPRAESILETVDGLGKNEVQVMRCTSSSFIFTALLIFWKAIVLFVGMYLSFAIRNVSSDFQESIWIFACSLVVLFTSILVLPTAYLVTTTAVFFYSFLVFSLLLSTLIVVALMLLPKFRRLRAVSSVRSTGTIRKKKASSTSSADQDSSTVTGTVGREMFNVFPAFIRMNSKWKTSASLSMTQVQPFEAASSTRQTRSATPGTNSTQEE